MQQKDPHDAALIHCNNVVSHAHWELLESFTRFTDADGRECYKLYYNVGNEISSILRLLTDYLERQTEDLR